MTQTQTEAPVAVIGAGIVGVAAALWLQREGREVILIDRAGPGEGTSYGNGGVVTPSSIVPVTVPGLLTKAPMMAIDPDRPLFVKWSYMPKLAPWLVQYLRHCRPEKAQAIATALQQIIGDAVADHEALAAGTAAEKWIVPCDFLYVYRNRAHFEDDAFTWSVRRSHGVEWEELEGAAFNSYDPVFAESLGFAARMQGHGRITDPGRYVKDLAGVAEANGARIVKADVDDIARRDGHVVGVRADGETIPCSAAILATGVWSGPLAKKLGLDIPLESERGYHIDLWEPNIVPKSPVAIASGRFVVTPMEGRLRLAGIVEFGGLDAPPSRAPFALLMRSVQKAIPGLTWREAKEWMGHRPAITDSLPVIGEAPGVRGAYLGFGHHHVGLTGGPKTGRLLAQLAAGQRPNIDLAPFAPSRFQ